MDNGAENYHRFIEGDDGGIAEIITDYRDGLVFFINGFIGDIETAEDIAEDTFVKIATKRPVFNGKSSFKTWLFAIGRNEAMGFLRRTKHKIFLSFDEALNADDTSPTPESSYFESEKNRAVHTALKRLKAEYYQVMWLYYFENMSCKEISEIIKKSVHNTEVMLHRARNSLKTVLEKEGFDYENL